MVGATPASPAFAVTPGGMRQPVPADLASAGTARDHVSCRAPRLRTVHLGVHFADRSALEDIDLAFCPAQTTSLVGPNGAGKSTLLKSLAGILQPTHGIVLLHGEIVRGPSPIVAYVPQRSEVDWTFPISVLDVALLGRGLQTSRFLPIPESDRQDALAALDEVGMRAFASVQIGALSGGQQQRVFLARALLQSAEVYLLDEPFTGVDVPTQALVLQVLADLRGTGKTIVFATHDLDMAARSSDQCVLLRRKVIASGGPGEVLTATNLHETFGGAAVLPFAPESRA
jgi:manganese/zinc/iron transport system ATP- binding protein